MRKSIAAAMSRSKREIPHYYLADEIVLDPALTWLAERNAARSITERVLPAVLQIKAVALAAHRFGEFNGFWRDDGFEPGNACTSALRSRCAVAVSSHPRSTTSPTRTSTS